MGLSVHRTVVIVRQHRQIGITAKLEGYHLPTGKLLKPRFYNGRIGYQYKSLRVGLTSLRRQPRCRFKLTINQPGLPF